VKFEFDLKRRYLCCASYIINFAANEGFFGENINVFECESCHTEGATVEILLWQKKGPISNYATVITCIRRTDQHSRFFRSLRQTDGSQQKRALEFVEDNDVRWNSTNG